MSIGGRSVQKQGAGEDFQGGSGPELEESVQRRWCNYHLMGKHLSGRLRKHICTGASLPTCSFPFA